MEVFNDHGIVGLLQSGLTMDVCPLGGGIVDCGCAGQSLTGRSFHSCCTVISIIQSDSGESSMKGFQGLFLCLGDSRGLKIIK